MKVTRRGGGIYQAELYNGTKVSVIHAKSLGIITLSVQDKEAHAIAHFKETEHLYQFMLEALETVEEKENES
jgi:hypothetical protein